MDTQTSAKLAEMTYEIGKTKVKKRIPDAIDNVNDHLTEENINYEVVPEWTDRNITTYRSKDDPNKIHISHKGTQFGSSTGAKDVLSDLKIAIGLGPHDKHVKRRKKRTERIIKNLNPDELTMSGHSLGGMTMNYTIGKSKKVRDKLLQADSFNAGSSFAFNNDLKLSERAKKELKEIPITHHRTRNDIVSKGLTDKGFGVPFGELKQYKLRPTKYEKEHNDIHSKGIKDKKELDKLNFGSKALYAHGLHHFSNRILDPVQKHKNTKSKKVKKSKIFSFKT
jgi:hypothetical protein